eukprot:scaffold13786_cov126-Skeletonema_marinoi.AAC.2
MSGESSLLENMKVGGLGLFIITLEINPQLQSRCCRCFFYFTKSNSRTHARGSTPVYKTAAYIIINTKTYRF